MKHKLTIVLISLLITLPACSKKKTDDDILKISFKVEPSSIDPSCVTDVNGGKICSLLYNRLVQFDLNMKIVPDLAESWNISKDQKTYTFCLKKDIKFSDGSQLTSDDVKTSFVRVVHPSTRSARAWLFEKVKGYASFRKNKNTDIKGFIIIDPFTFQIKLKKPYAPFLSMLTFPNASIAKYAGKAILGTGPMILENWEHDQYIDLIWNPYSESPHSSISRVRYIIQPENLTRSTDFEMGNLDIMDLPEEEYLYFSQHPKWKNYIFKQTGLNFYYLGMNCANAPLNQLEARQFINSRLDIDIILNTLYQNRAIRAEGPVPPSLLKYPAMKQSQFKNTIALSRPLILLQSKKTENYLITEIIQHQLSKAGIPIQIQTLEWSSFKSRITEGNYDLFILSWWADYPDPENFLVPLFHSRNHGAGGNYTHFQDSYVDQMLDQAEMTIDEELRLEIYRKVILRIQELHPMIFLWHKIDQVIVQPSIQNYTLSTVYTIPDILTLERHREA